jgi:hypothetical protein
MLDLNRPSQPRLSDLLYFLFARPVSCVIRQELGVRVGQRRGRLGNKWTAFALNKWLRIDLNSVLILSLSRCTMIALKLQVR